MKIAELISLGETKLSQISSIPKLESLILLEHILGMEREFLLAYPEKDIPDNEIKSFYNLLAKRVNDKTPLSYIINNKEFYSLNFYVNENVLIPRPETEKIVEISIEILKTKTNPKVLDLGTGSGNIITSISFYNMNKAIYYASDISYKAIKIARYNALKHNQNINFFISDIFSGIKKGKLFDLIVSNPPYVAKKDYENLDKQVLKEPKIALLANDDGLYFIKQIINNADSFLKKDGKLIIETGDLQAQKIIELYGSQNLRIIDDDFGKKRFLLYSPKL